MMRVRHPRTVWRIVAVNKRVQPAVLPVRLVVATRARGVVDAIERAAGSAGVVLERVEEEDGDE